MQSAQHTRPLTLLLPWKSARCERYELLCVCVCVYSRLVLLWQELDRAQELFEQEKKEIHARYTEEREAEQKHQAFREEQHRVLVEENKKLEEKFEHIEEKARQLERAKHEYEKKTAELEAAKGKASADVMQRVAVEKKKLEAEFAVKLERSGAAALNAECERLKKTSAQLTRTPCCCVC